MKQNGCDVGLLWGKCLNILSQIGALAGIVNLLMVIGIFYTTTFRPATGMSLWLYLLLIVIGGASLVVFIITVGIRGFYRFFNQQSAVDEIRKDIQLIKRHLKIEEE